jgi:hypothetical protein
VVHKNNGRLPQSTTVVKAYLELLGFENTGGEYQDTILNPASAGFFIYNDFFIHYIYEYECNIWY